MLKAEKVCDWLSVVVLHIPETITQEMDILNTDSFVDTSSGRTERESCVCLCALEERKRDVCICV